MNKTEAQFALAKLSPAAQAVWEDDELDGVDAAIIAELVAAGLVEQLPSWNDRAREIAGALEPLPGGKALVEQMGSEGFEEAIDTFFSWTDILTDFDLDAGAAQAIIDGATRTIREAHENALLELAALPSVQSAAAA